MSYQVIIDGWTLPVTPAQVQIEYPNQNQTLKLLSFGEINFLRPLGLLNLSFEALLPRTPYPFAQYPAGFQTAEYYLAQLLQLKKQKKFFYLSLAKAWPGGGRIDCQSYKVSLEEFKQIEGAEQGFDVVVQLKFKQYAYYGGKKLNINQGQAAVVTASPKATPERFYVVQAGDNLNLLALKFYGDAAKAPLILAANQTLFAANAQAAPDLAQAMAAGAVDLRGFAEPYGVPLVAGQTLRIPAA